MKFTSRQLVTCLLVAVYGGVSVLGEALHLLSPHDGHHHGFEVVHCKGQSASHEHDSHHGLGDNDGTTVVASHEGECDSHLCSVCTLLFQARSAAPQLPTEIFVWQHAVAAAMCPPQQSYIAVILGPHSARAPPTGVA
jgi:hypothetical protein